MSAAELLSVQSPGAYLDTSVVRAYSGKDTWLKHASAHTSVLTLIELLDGSTAKVTEYLARRAAIKRLIDFDIPIMRYLPIITVMRAFPYVHGSIDLSTKAYDTVMDLAEVMMKTECAKDFEVHLNSSPVWLKLQQEYSSFARDYLASFTDQTKSMRNAFASSSNQDLAKLGIDKELKTSDRMRSFIKNPLNRASSLFALAKASAISIDQRGNEKVEKAIYESYNQLARPYIDAIATTFITRMSDSELPAMNDLYDQEHFAYLEPNVLLVSNDKRMRVLASTIGLKAVGNIEFRRMAQFEIAKKK